MAKITVDDCVEFNLLASVYWAQLKNAAQEGRIDIKNLNRLIGLVPPGLYEHFKSQEDDPKFYAVSGVVPDVNGRFDPVVKYTALYGPLAGKPAGRILFEPDDAFWGPIIRPEAESPYVGPRFTRTMMLSVREVAMLEADAHIIAVYKTRTATLTKIEWELRFIRSLLSRGRA